MSTAEELAFSIRQEGRGVHVLLWDDQGDLVRALLMFWASLGPAPFEAMLLASTADIEFLRAKIPSPSVEGGNEAGQPARPLWLLFLQQASARVVGHWLNGWRRPLSDAPGTLLLIRHADYEPFQRAAPDLASYVGPRVYDAARMLSTASTDIVPRINLTLLRPVRDILRKLPGALPPEDELNRWVLEVSRLAG